MIRSPGYRPFLTTPLRTLSTATSPFTYTNTSGRYQVMMVSGGLLVAISLGGLSLGLTAASFPVRPGDTVSIAFTTAPLINILDIM